MRLHSALAVAAIFCKAANAIFADDAWQVDYHLALLGAPQEHTTFFHQPFAGSKASLLYTLSDKAVLGAVHPKDGNLVWRQALSTQNNASSTFLRAGAGQDIVISAVDSELTGWSAGDGRQLWSTELGGQVKDLEILELQDGREGVSSKDAIVLTGHDHPTLRRIDTRTGEVTWEFKDESGDIPHQVSASATGVYLISMHKNLLGGVKVKVVSLDPTNGRKTDQHSLASDSDLSSVEDILTVGANSASPIIAWTDKARGVLKVNIIGTKGVSTFNIDSAGSEIKKVSLHAPHHIDAHAHFLVHYETSTQHWAEVYHVDLKSSTVKKAYNLPKLGGAGVFSTSVSDANVYFTRVSEGEVSVVSSASHGILARWPVSSLGASHIQDMIPLHAVSEVSVKGDSVAAVRSAIFLSSGDWVLVRDGTVSWQRPEALAGTISAVWAYPPIKEDLIQELEVEGHGTVIEAYIHRTRRHLKDLRLLPGYLVSLPDKFLHSISLGKASQMPSPAHDNFGYHKFVVCATDSGRLIALDAGEGGQVVWNVQALPVHPGAAWELPQVVANPDGTVQVLDAETHAWISFNASTGSKLSSSAQAAAGNPPTQPDSEYTYALTGDAVVGMSTHQASAAPFWEFKPIGDQHITGVISRPTEDPVASIGKVLGDRKVLYKYLNPNLLLVVAVSDTEKTASFYVLDAVTGSTISSKTHANVDASSPISYALSENWFAYSFAVDSVTTFSKGYQLVIGELYESPLPNDRGPLGATHNFSTVRQEYEPYVAMQTYSIPEPISHMAVTQTRQGITSRQLLAVMAESGAIVGIPRAVIDPRRPVGRDPTSNEAAEGLMRYAPVLDFDAKWYLNHQRELLGIEKITTSPAMLESTSLVFAYGLDVFGTRVSPSFSFDVLGKDFNKLQMLATVAALAVGTLVVAPLVKRKQINARWLFQ